MRDETERISLVRFITIAALVLISLFTIWFNHIYTDPTRVFWGMIDNNLSTPGVTKDLVQKSDIIQTDSLTRLWFNPGPVVRNLRKISDFSSGAPAKITLESIADAADVYQRYSFIDQPGTLGQKKPDYSRLYKLWLKDGGANINNGQIFNGGLFGFLFFGNFSPGQRSTLVNYLKSAKIYDVDYANVSRSSSGRRNYTYSVKLNTKNYLQAARIYVKQLGLPQNSWVESGSLTSSLAADAHVSVDVLSRQPTRVTYPGSGTTEIFKAFGLNSSVTLPAHIASLSDYQNALNSINQ